MPKNSFTVKEDVQINSLVSTKQFLIVGTVGEICGYNWKNVKASKQPSCAWSIDFRSAKDSFDKPDINYLIFNKENDQLYVACGDNNIYIIDLETRKEVKAFKGHKDYVHCITHT